MCNTKNLYYYLSPEEARIKKKSFIFQDCTLKKKILERGFLGGLSTRKYDLE